MTPTVSIQRNRRGSGDGHARRMSGPVAAMARDEPPRSRAGCHGKWLSRRAFVAALFKAGRMNDWDAMRMTTRVAVIMWQSLHDRLALEALSLRAVSCAPGPPATAVVRSFHHLLG